MSVVYPRLDVALGPQLLAECSGLTNSELLARSGLSHPRTTFYETAPRRVSPEELGGLQRAVRELASQHGYPSARVVASLTAFDQELSVLLHRQMDIVTADAADERVWSFMSLVLLPDIAFWRYPNNAGKDDYERILGKPRNVFRRLWWRAHILGEEISARIGEDRAVAIMERPKAFGGDPRIANRFAVVVLERIDRAPGVRGDAIMREAAKRLLRVFTVVTAGALPDDQLTLLMEEVVDEAVTALRSRADSPVADMRGVAGSDVDGSVTAATVVSLPPLTSGSAAQNGGPPGSTRPPEADLTGSGGLMRGLLRRVRGNSGQ